MTCRSCDALDVARLPSSFEGSVEWTVCYFYKGRINTVDCTEANELSVVAPQVSCTNFAPFAKRPVLGFFVDVSCVSSAAVYCARVETYVVHAYFLLLGRQTERCSTLYLSRDEHESTFHCFRTRQK